MARLVALFVLTIAVYTVSAYVSQPRCGPCEEWTTCGQLPSCDARCNIPRTTVCPLVCVARCQCQKGYLRDEDNYCVPPSKECADIY